MVEYLVYSTMCCTVLAPPGERVAHQVAHQEPRRVLACEPRRVQIQSHSEKEVLQFAMLATEFWWFL